MIENKTKSIGILGCGWLGTPVAEHFINKGFAVVGSTTRNQKLNELSQKGINPVLVNIDEENNDFSELFKVDYLLINIPSKNIEGFKSVVKQLEKSSVKKVIFVSSTSVYQNTNDWVVEDNESLLKPCALLTIENLFTNNKSFETTVIRFSGLTNEDRHPGRFFTNKPIADSDAPVNMIVLEDCIELIDKVIEGEVWNQIFNGCGDEHIAKKEYYTSAKKDLNLPLPEFNIKAEKDFKIVSNAKAKQILKHNFRSILFWEKQLK